MIISIFIVLNTMIGSVYERKREIAVYTSVGLAPSHVSVSVRGRIAGVRGALSAVLGYLLAQTSASLFAGTGCGPASRSTTRPWRASPQCSW
jgi:ABC-type antimicrobial peptide transport system permease subunit